MPEGFALRAAAHQVDGLELPPRLVAFARGDEREAPGVHFGRGAPFVMRARWQRLQRSGYSVGDHHVLTVELAEQLDAPVEELERIVDAELQPVEAVGVAAEIG